MSEQGRPLTPEEAKDVVRRTAAEITRGGLWAKVCVHCGEAVGCRLGSYGQPTPAELRHTVCPRCYRPEWREGYDGAQHLRLEFLPGTETN